MEYKIELIPESIQLIKMSDEEYFSSKYKDYISNSKLSLLNPNEGGSIEKFLSGFKSEYSDSYELGSAVHAITLQPDLYYISDIRKPSGKLGLFAEKVFDYRQKNITITEAIKKASIDADYYAKGLSEKRIKTAIESSYKYYLQRLQKRHLIEEKTPVYLSEGIYLKFEQCMLGISENKKFKTTLFPESLFSTVEVYNEYAIFCEIKVTLEEESRIIKVKGKLDNFTINHETEELTLNDLKTTGKFVNYFMGNTIKKEDDNGEEISEFIPGSFQKFHYYRQMALYGYLLQCAIKHLRGLNYKLKCNMLVVETIPTFRSKVFSVTNGSIKFGISEFKKLLGDVSWIEKR